ncbi:hypothetical protein BDA99DRAFT_543475 [Phascolomyces articulosus]|uniref:Uncharacterized protein n=1 Tax=Phascolomyces articulosus TaxID=60185 RepID=A0AAD5JXS4_9FUNG|nr:hypothetical protein BDA99DRAFT_543475 [Phascolomyces articulosus]
MVLHTSTLVTHNFIAVPSYLSNTNSYSYGTDKLDELNEAKLPYYDPLLSELISEQDKNVALGNQEHIDMMHLDAIDSTITQHNFGNPVGFEGAKYGKSINRYFIRYLVQVSKSENLGQLTYHHFIVTMANSFLP